MSRQMCPEKVEAAPCECPPRSCTLREFRRMAEPGGRERAREEYYDELRAAAARLDVSKDPQDMPYRLQQIGIPHEDITALRGVVDDSLAILAAKKFIAAPRDTYTFLLLMGEPSVGKSLAAAYVIRDAARKYDWNNSATSAAPIEPLQFVTAADLTRVDNYSSVDNARLDSMRKCKLLVVDDMGDEGGAPGRSALVGTILKRDAAGRQTVITTNLKAERFREMYGAPFAARVVARGIVPDLSKEKSRRKRVA